MSMFDKVTLAVDKPGRMLIIHPKTRAPFADKDGNFAYVDVHSSDSEVLRKLVRDRASKKIEERVRKVPSIAEIEAEGVETSAVLTAGWYLLSLDPVENEIDGKTVLAHEPVDAPFSIENAKQLYAIPGGAFIREQVDAYAGSRENFAKASPKS